MHKGIFFELQFTPGFDDFFFGLFASLVFVINGNSLQKDQKCIGHLGLFTPHFPNKIQNKSSNDKYIDTLPHMCIFSSRFLALKPPHHTRRTATINFETMESELF